MRDFLERLLKGRYVRLLEAELSRQRAETDRLRAENRALMNSLLGTAGIAPIDFPAAPQPQPLPRLRKRSWHQLQAWRENSAAAHGAGIDFESKEEVRQHGRVPHS